MPLCLSLCLSSSLSEVREESIVQAVGCEDRRGSGRHYARGARLPSSTKEKRINRERYLVFQLHVLHIRQIFSSPLSKLWSLVSHLPAKTKREESSADQERISLLQVLVVVKFLCFLQKLMSSSPPMCWPASRISNPVVSSKSTSINSAWFDIWALLLVQ